MTKSQSSQSTAARFHLPRPPSLFLFLFLFLPIPISLTVSPHCCFSVIGRDKAYVGERTGGSLSSLDPSPPAGGKTPRSPTAITLRQALWAHVRALVSSCLRAWTGSGQPTHSPPPPPVLCLVGTLRAETHAPRHRTACTGMNRGSPDVGTADPRGPPASLSLLTPRYS